MALQHRSMSVPRCTAASTPSGTETRIAAISDSGTSVRVLGSRSKNTSTAGLR